jgi:hypothetical protein
MKLHYTRCFCIRNSLSRYENLNRLKNQITHASNLQSETSNFTIFARLTTLTSTNSYNNLNDLILLLQDLPEIEESMDVNNDKTVPTEYPLIPKQASLATMEEDLVANPAGSNTPDQSQTSEEQHTPKKFKEEDCPIAASILADIVNPSSGNTRTPFRPPVYSENLLQVPPEVQIYLFGALSSKYLREVSLSA